MCYKKKGLYLLLLYMHIQITGSVMRVGTRLASTYATECLTDIKRFGLAAPFGTQTLHWFAFRGYFAGGTPTPPESSTKSFIGQREYDYFFAWKKRRNIKKFTGITMA